MTWSKKGTSFARPGGTGFGVRLLDEFIKSYLKVTYNKLEVNLYFIKSDFKDILARIGKKIFEEKERFLVKFNKNHDLTEIIDTLDIRKR